MATTEEGKVKAKAVTAYYNEFDPYAAQWLRNLIAAGHIAPGIVDERSIEDVTPADLAGFTQCHFFAGVGVWSLALRKAGWPDDRPVWTGSCPCQPFSAAGAGAGFADERHLWPAFNHLIAQCRPPVVFGEQVASKTVEPWVDLVHADLEALGYAFGAVPFPSAGVGAPHIRDRLFWVAESDSDGLHRAQGIKTEPSSNGADGRLSIRGSGDSLNRVADTNGDGLLDGLNRAKIEGPKAITQYSSASRMANSELQQRPNGETGISLIDESGGRLESSAATTGLCGNMPAGPVNGMWADADWLGCRDGKWRPVEPGTFPLADGATSRVGRLRADWRSPAGKENQGSRVGRLRAYGNAINAEAARIFIESYLYASNG